MKKADALLQLHRKKADMRRKRTGKRDAVQKLHEIRTGKAEKWKSEKDRDVYAVIRYSGIWCGKRV